MAKPRRERDLFGDDDEAADPNELVELVLVHVDQTPRAWLLRRAGRPNSQHYAPKSLVTRGEPPHDDVWSLPRWLAADRGWL